MYLTVTSKKPLSQPLTIPTTTAMMGEKFRKDYSRKGELPCHKNNRNKKAGKILRSASVVLMVGLYFLSQTLLVTKVHTKASSGSADEDVGQTQPLLKTRSSSNSNLTHVQRPVKTNTNTIQPETRQAKVSAPRLLPVRAAKQSTSSSVSQPVDGMAACLLIKDDNHLLIEWIAYHYLTLPLKYLVIAVDPDSFTSPLPIINRWNNSKDLDIEIMLWNDEDYMNKTHLATRLNKRINAFQNSSIKEEEFIKLHRERQASFLPQCSMYHKSKNRTWVAHIDTDEYIVFNYVHDDDRKVHNTRQRYNRARDRLPSIGQRTVMEVLSRQNSRWTQKGCLPMIRILFGPHQEISERKAETTASIEGISKVVDYRKLNTMQFFRHSRAGNKTINGLQKVLLDVSKNNDNYLDDFFSIHKPSNNLCPTAYFSPQSYADSLLRVHHYLGSWEQYNARVDDRRSRNVFDAKALASSAYGPHYDIKPWMEHFIRKVGIDKAKYLLKGAGEIEVNWEEVQRYHKDMDKPTCALMFFGIPRSFVSTVFPSIKRYILDANPTCDVFVHSYNVSVVRGNRMGEASGNVYIEELDAFKQYYSNSQSSYELMLETEDDFQRQRNVTYFRQFFPRPSAWEYPTSMDNMIRQWHSIESGWKLMESHEKKAWRRFDKVGFFRLDVKYTHPIDILTNETAVIPAMMYEQAKPTGINDRLFYGSRDVGALWATDRFNSVEDYLAWQEGNIDRVRCRGLHSEEFLRYLLVQKWSFDITLRNICFQRVRTSGTILSTDCDVFGDNAKGGESVRGVVLLGMHRSGTSLLAGLLVHGLSYQAPGELIAANGQNPYGFYENLNVARQNNQWLKEQGKTWDRLNIRTLPNSSAVVLNAFNPGLSCATDSCASSASPKKDRLYFDHRNKALASYNDPSIFPWMMKEPRLCVTLKLWLEILKGAPPAVIFTFRNPLEVALSLQARSVKQVKVLADGLILWIWYNRLALENSRGLCRIVTR